MKLRSMRLRGFKSFADVVTVRFGDGLNAIVGPNGSGKSNIVDALSWVLGAQSPRLLRLTRMDEVIFQGSERRAALGRAEVELTIEDPEGVAGLGVAEISLARRVERGGEASYRINGRVARLADVVEVLHAANIGRTQHVIVSQGEVDALAAASGEQLRTMLEDASGVSALRRQHQLTVENLRRASERLEELEREDRELRRQRRPLLAQVARLGERRALEERWREVALVAARRAIEARRDALAQATATLGAAQARLSQAQTALEAARTALDSPMASTPADPEVLATWVQRLRSREEDLAAHGRVLEGVRAELAAREQALAAARAASEERAGLERELAELEQRARELVERRIELEHRLDALELPDLEELRARWSRIGAQRASLAATLAERARARERAEARRSARVQAEAELRARLEQLKEALGRLELEEQEAGAALAELETVVGELDERRRVIDEALEALTTQRLASQREVATQEAVAAQLEAALKKLRAQLEAQGGVTGWDLVHPTPGRETLAAAVLGPLAEAQLLEDPAQVAWDVEDANLLLGPLGGRESGSVELGFAPSPLGDRLARARVVDDVLAAALGPDEVVVDGRGWVREGAWLRRSRGERAALRLRQRRIAAELEEATQRLGQERARAETLERAWREQVAQLDVLRSEQRERRRALEHAQRDARERARRRLELERERAALLARLSETMKARAEDDVEDGGGDEVLTARLGELAEEEAAVAVELADSEAAAQRALAERREFEAQLVEVRLEASRAQQRARVVRERLEILARAVQFVGAAEPGELAVRARVLEDRSARLGALVEQVVAVRRGLEEALRAVLAHQARLREVEERRRVAEREAARELDEAQAAYLSAARALEREQARLAAEVETWSLRLRVDAATLEAAPAAVGVAPGSERQVLEELEQRLAGFGEVNGLAEVQLRELDQRRHELAAVLSEARLAHAAILEGLGRLEDAMRSELCRTIEEVSTAFDRTLGELFDGGRGALSFEEAADPLEASVRVDVVLPRKRVRRLALLSGGERSLVGLGLLFAVLEVRPVPFLVLDEADAALDERNLVRLVGLLRRFAARTQVLAVTHQRRTMEAADVLLGVSIAPSGVSTVVRHDLAREPLPAGS